MNDSKKPRTKREITVGQAVDRLLRFRMDRHVAADNAVAKVHERFAAREAEYLCSLKQTVKDRALAMVDAEYDVSITALRGAPPELSAAVAEPEPAVDDVPDRLREPLPESRLRVGRK